MNKKIILIGGYGATGKSAFAKWLSGQLKIPYFDKDTIKEILANDSMDTHEKSRALSKDAFNVIMFIAIRQMEAGQPCIMESNYRNEEMIRLNTLISNNGFDCLTYIFEGEIETIYDRFVIRDQSDNRHKIHKLHNIDTFEKFEQTAKPFGNLSTQGEAIRVDTTSFDKVDYEELLKYAAVFMNKKE